ncbi:hypothetical protein HNP52_001729 [Sphingomonas kyeonggiensis]|uniref:Immunity protein 49 of polymorphic toxin system n=1 Tax=Sphingomonas kyeonggiensis TaxID=1268553 RepID=A0A7W7K1I4_9SPHN|nr:hypothetical protein [Sphingomonas kyeonggiensis]MBB4838660.1 hypothetical protein [Sphingomonas kyeonggiensis]
METYGFEPEFLERRISFLTSRARAHQELGRGEPRTQGYAATLLRDAAAVALIAGDVEKARGLFGQAGAMFEALGIPHGHLLRLLAGEEGGEALAKARFDAGWALHRGQAADQAEIQLPPALQVPVQRLALIQALSFDKEQNGLELAASLRERDALVPQPAGPSGLPISVYLRLLDRLEGTEGWGYEDPHPDDLSRLIAHRLEQVEAMQADRFHWDRLLSPAALLDISTVVLGMIAIRNGGTMFEDLPRDEIAWLPIRAAEMLSGGRPEPEPEWEPAW